MASTAPSTTKALLGLGIVAIMAVVVVIHAGRWVRCLSLHRRVSSGILSYTVMARRLMHVLL